MSEEHTSLEDVLSDAPPPPPAAPEPPAPVEPPADAPPAAPPVERAKSRKKEHQEKEFAAQGLVRDPDTGQFSKKAEDAAAAPEAPSAPAAAPAVAQPQEMTDKEKAFLRAAQEERTKRQEGDRKREDLERRLAAFETPAAPKEFWDDPQSHLKEFEKRMNETVVNTRFNTAETIARSKYADFDEKLAVFGTLLTPELKTQWEASPDPGEFAYRIGKNKQDIEQVGGIDALIKKNTEETTAKVRAQVESEYKAKAEAAAKERAALPGSLSDARGTSNPSRPVYSGPTSLEDILKG